MITLLDKVSALLSAIISGILSDSNVYRIQHYNLFCVIPLNYTYVRALVQRIKENILSYSTPCIFNNDVITWESILKRKPHLSRNIWWYCCPDSCRYVYIQCLFTRIHQQTGVIWEMCKASESMPKTNHHCLVQKLEQVSALVEDALSELEEVRVF